MSPLNEKQLVGMSKVKEPQPIKRKLAKFINFSLSSTNLSEENRLQIEDIERLK